MPELPEVETVREQMEKELIGDSIESIKVLDRMCFEGDEDRLRGKKISGISRIGKWLFVHFETGEGAEIHLKMTGRLTINENYEDKEHTRVIIRLKSGRSVYYWDTRRFGYIKPLNNLENAKFQLSARLGPEPVEISEKELIAKLNKTARKIKDVLLDQSIMAGVGNIYANDGLWEAGIRPTRIAKSLSSEEVVNLLKSVRKVMGSGLKAGGASDNTYRDFYGNMGSYQDEFLVYGKTNGICLKCGGKLKYEKVSGRGTWWCHICQR